MHLGDPAILPLRIVCPRLRHDGRGTAEVLDVLLRGVPLRQWIQVGRIGVVPAQVLLVHRLGVVRRACRSSRARPSRWPGPAARPTPRRSLPACSRGSSAARSGRGCTCRGRADSQARVRPGRGPTSASDAARSGHRCRGRTAPAPRPGTSTTRWSREPRCRGTAAGCAWSWWRSRPGSAPAASAGTGASRPAPRLRASAGTRSARRRSCASRSACVMDMVGASSERPIAPTPSILPRPASTEPRSPRGSEVPN